MVLRLTAALLVGAAGEEIVIGRVYEDAVLAHQRVELGLAAPLHLHAVCGVVVVVVVRPARVAGVRPVRLEHCSQQRSIARVAATVADRC